MAENKGLPTASNRVELIERALERSRQQRVYESSRAIALRAGSVRRRLPSRATYRDSRCANSGRGPRVPQIRRRPRHASRGARTPATRDTSTRSDRRVSVSPANGTWKRAIGRRRSVQGHPEVAMIEPEHRAHGLLRGVSAYTLRSNCSDRHADRVERYQRLQRLQAPRPFAGRPGSAGDPAR